MNIVECVKLFICMLYVKCDLQIFNLCCLCYLQLSIFQLVQPHAMDYVGVQSVFCLWLTDFESNLQIVDSLQVQGKTVFHS